MVDIKVTKIFRDAETRDLHHPGEVIKKTNERAATIVDGKYATYVEQPTTPDTSTQKEDKATGKQTKEDKAASKPETK